MLIFAFMLSDLSKGQVKNGDFDIRGIIKTTLFSCNIKAEKVVYRIGLEWSKNVMTGLLF